MVMRPRIAPGVSNNDSLETKTPCWNLFVDFVRDGLHGKGADRAGSTRWRRLTEERAGSAKSVFHFDVPGSVAKSTHAGIPWLLYLQR